MFKEGINTTTNHMVNSPVFNTTCSSASITQTSNPLGSKYWKNSTILNTAPSCLQTTVWTKMKVWALHSTPPSHHCPNSNLVRNIFESSQQPNPSWSTNLKPHYQKMSPAFNLLWCPWRLDGIGVFKQARLILRGLPRDEAIKVAETQTSVLGKGWTAWGISYLLVTLHMLWHLSLVL